MRRTLLAVALIALAGCAPKPDPAVARAAAELVEARRLMAEPPEKIAERITALEYPTYRALMAFGGLDEALGGPAPADAALRGLMAHYRRTALGARADLPRIFKTAGGAEPINGYSGLAMSVFIGVLAIPGLVEAGGQAESGKLGGERAGGQFNAEFTKDHMSTDAEFTGAIDGLNGNVKTKVSVDACPDANGRVNATFESDSNMTKPGSPAGARLKVTVKLAQYVDDDANLTSDFESDTRVEQSSYSESNGSYVDLNSGVSTRSAEANRQKVNRRSTRATDADVTAAQGAASMGRLAAFVAINQASKAWNSGRCVNLQATSTPAKRSGVKPGTSFDILAAPRSKIDGAPTGGTVRADLTGAGALDPAGAKAPADAHFTYRAADERNKAGTVKLESRSRRGVGLASLTFDTGGGAYMAEGGADDFHGTGKICDLAQPFTISGGGNVVKFTPSSPTGGAYTYAGNMSGVEVWGSGTYSVTADESGGTITASGPGSVRTPVGVASNTGTEKYTLTPTAPCADG